MKTGNIIRRAGMLAACLILMASSVLAAAICEQCGANLPENARFCPKCGAKVPRPTTDPDAKRIQNPRLRSGIGMLKVGSAPTDCVVSFGGNSYNKDKSVLTFDDVPAGSYTVVFSAAGKKVEKRVMVKPGEITFVFADLTDGKTPVRQPARTAPAAASRKQENTRMFKSIQDADDNFAAAETLRRAINPLRKESRYREAERLYRKIIERWPESDKVEDSHYSLGLIYESVFFRDYDRAIEEYLNVIDANLRTQHDARWRIAQLYEGRLKNMAKAREWYELSAELSQIPKVRESAKQKAQDLKTKGF